jgi:site-specific DNA-cytosine methylase
VKARVYGVVSLFCGLGGKTLGFLQARGHEGSRFESVGAFDKNSDACEDFYLLTGARAQSVDLGKIDPGDFANLCKRRPDVVILSPPCQGYSGCLPEALSQTEKYQDLNELALRSINLVLEAWSVPPAFILLENVPRMKTRGRDLLVQIKALLWEKGYETDLRTHDCGVLGGLAQSRERVLLVAGRVRSGARRWPSWRGRSGGRRGRSRFERAPAGSRADHRPRASISSKSTRSTLRASTSSAGDLLATRSSSSRRLSVSPSSKDSNRVDGARPSPKQSLRTVSMLAEKPPCSIRRTVSDESPARRASTSWVIPRARRRDRMCLPNSRA